MLKFTNESILRSKLSTWHTDFRLLQPGASCTHFLGPSFSQRPHCELEGAAWDVLPAVLDIYRVHAHLMWHEAHAVGVVAHRYNLSRFSGA